MATSATLMLHLTGRCNLECRHCYMDGSPRRREALPFDWVAQALRAAPGLGIGTLFLTGGEPLLYARFADVARVAAEVAGLATTVCTNATVVRRRDAALLARLGFDAHVSIDGMPGHHDLFRARDGAFRKAERGIGLLLAAGVPVTIVTTISRGNVEQFEQIAGWALAAGARRLLVQPLLDLGRGMAIGDQQLSGEQLNRLILQTSDFGNRSAGRIAASIIGGSKRFLLAHPCAAYVCNGGGCHRGVSAEIKKVVVREDGTVLPEATNLDHRYALGNVADGSLAELVQRYFPAGYAAFDRLCRSTYEQCVPDWPAPIVPWDQLLALHSRSVLPAPVGAAPERGCGGGGAGKAAAAPIWIKPGSAA
ncbi:radical SAM protein [Duganella aceris]|uniref:Radical SAM protein n=1 Tax=Duganella aceris TaxID=2703883 RepID=A0ABX0FGM3_9BURK|nr:radical SAM protein [Duganella aceris]NGZ83709.1 radical SAM protein [Duganella aceris]